jgi:hypothetical protein
MGHYVGTISFSEPGPTAAAKSRAPGEEACQLRRLTTTTGTAVKFVITIAALGDLQENVATDVTISNRNNLAP